MNEEASRCIIRELSPLIFLVDISLPLWVPICNIAMNKQS